ncbi:hypothetical protein HIM_05218 [Hirsutella minnesotensis 3608]|uniref:ML-like domain-containing protein n=1 Tax=Hirsutella minnesotensis 3608 TaxID=1043627 RepID=A0A0F8A0F7_9HYPO|nr:hypothetical protein HIM_05218 [Hirsutella minnesotensis 3608]
MPSLLTAAVALLSAAATLSRPVAAERLLMSNSLNTCQPANRFTASLFKVVYTPGNNSAAVELAVTSSIEGKVVFDLALSAYGHRIMRRTVNPCEMEGLKGLCPMTSGKNTFNFNLALGADASRQIPSIAYNIPDLDAGVRVFVNLTSGESVACLEADISNGKTVNLIGVKWATAVIAALALLSSAVFNGLGHYNTAAHVAANSLSLFGYFQAQAMVGLTSVRLPPLVQAWTLNLQWSMGLIRVGFMQDIFTWYQRATGGTPSYIFDTLTTVSVQVAKRSLDYVESTRMSLFNRAMAMTPTPVVTAANHLMKRGNVMTGSGSYLVYGIQRVAFQLKIESTNLFITSLCFFYLLLVFTAIAVLGFRLVLELCVRRKWTDKLFEFRNGWKTIVKGIFFRICLIGFSPVCIFCLWEFTQNDSPAEMVLAALFLCSLILTLGWGASQVIRIARRSLSLHGNPAYILFADPQTLNKWGFLYMQFRASAYYFIAPVLLYTFLKSILIGLGQKSGNAQAIGFIILEAMALIAASVMRPWMDKSTNSFNIAICAVNFVNAICLLIFTNVFGTPRIIVGVFGIVTFILNAAFSLILLIMVIISTTINFFRKDPDARYQIMADDRASFIKSQAKLATTSQLDELAATARGDKMGTHSRLDLDDEAPARDGSIRMGSVRGRAASQQSWRHDGSPSPVNPTNPLIAGQLRPESPFRSLSPLSHSGSSAGPPRSRNASPFELGLGHSEKADGRPDYRGVPG